MKGNLNGGFKYGWKFIAHLIGVPRAGATRQLRVRRTKLCHQSVVDEVGEGPWEADAGQPSAECWASLHCWRRCDQLVGLETQHCHLAEPQIPKSEQRLDPERVLEHAELSWLVFMGGSGRRPQGLRWRQDPFMVGTPVPLVLPTSGMFLLLLELGSSF